MLKIRPSKILFLLYVIVQKIPLNQELELIMTWEEFKENLKNKTFLIGITFVDENGDIIDEYQTSGKVLELTDNGILKLKRENENFFQIPYDNDSIFAAQKGEYKEKSSGKIIVDPDFITQWTVSKNDIKSVDEIKKFGFIE
ncbi:hypothetical protein D1Z98_06975 [Riemerella anatipestifer]|nr:hypothetical protein [Riemerella anatipestifer]MRM94724.1 hypothetical protein [Riemerella anatipestifer]MRN16796.1 hypothetical protein [Riemerella anatipestifer]